jgi:hypothetical protein
MERISGDKKSFDRRSSNLRRNVTLKLVVSRFPATDAPLVFIFCGNSFFLVVTHITLDSSERT